MLPILGNSGFEMRTGGGFEARIGGGFGVRIRVGIDANIHPWPSRIRWKAI